MPTQNEIKPDLPDVIRSYLLNLQQKICDALCAEECTASFDFDTWTREEGGGGISALLFQGSTLERAGVNFSHIHGKSLPSSALGQRAALLADTSSPYAFEAMGVSVVVHPQNPYVPTSHMNVRFFRTKEDNLWWFGGGFDLTPYYPFEEDCIYWHTMAKKACDPFGEGVYARYKKWCDEYFYLKHRKEPRGIGGLFFDDLNEWPIERCFEFIQSVAEHYCLAYQTILAKRKNTPFTQSERDFQLYRRGRYVEFNLIYDRGTLFGLQSGGRTESILMSLPPQVRWEYDWKPEKGSKESVLYEEYLRPRDWVRET